MRWKLGLGTPVLVIAALLIQVGCSTLPDSKRGFDSRAAFQQMNKTLTEQRRHTTQLDSGEWEEYLGRMNPTRWSQSQSRTNWMMNRSYHNWAQGLTQSSVYDRERAAAKLHYFQPVSALTLEGNQ